MSVAFSLSIQQPDFDVGVEYNQLVETAKNLGYNQTLGAIVFFVGCVRARTTEELVESQVNALELAHYPGMTEQVLQDILEQAKKRWRLQAARIVHRVGKLHSGEQIVFVATVSEHRAEAFNAAEFLMDVLKTQAPFWKKEISTQGEHWVEAKNSDTKAADRW